MTADPEADLLQDIASFTHDPLGFALYAYPWGEGELDDATGPRGWQADVMRDIGRHLTDPETRHSPLLVSVASGHGIGKSGLISMITNWGMSTCEDCRVLITANTDTQLRTKTWPEVSKWFRLGINAHWFNVTATSVTAADKEHSRSWRADAVPWSENNTEAFAGLHNKGKRIIVIFDEASNIADKVWEVAEGAMTDEDTEIIWIAFGNPTRNTGRFRECFGKYRHRWIGRQIDSRTVEGTNKKFLQGLVDTYGEDHDIVKVRVRGMFPSASSLQFIGSDLVEAAAKREVAPQPHDPLVLGVDVARFGDDQSVIYVRKGRDGRTIPPIKLRGVDTMQLAARVAEERNRWRADAVFVDGGGVGAGVVDRLRQLRIPVFEVQFGGKAERVEFGGDIVKVANKRAEMWANMREWLKGGAIPDDPELSADLTGVEYGFNIDNAIQLERKEDMKKRGLSSPDVADALALTFAYPVTPNAQAGGYMPAGRPGAVSDYDPYQ